jgi:hypothetical protein
LAVGLVASIIGYALVFSSFSSLLNLPVYETPTTLAVECHAGDYYVYQQAGPDRTDPTTLTYNQVQVEDPRGAELTTWQGSGLETLTQNGVLYNGAVGFHVPVAGTYTVTIAAAQPSAVLVGPSLGATFQAALPALALAISGGLVMLIGIILLVIAAVRRTRSKAPMATPSYPPPYGHPGYGYPGYGAPHYPPPVYPPPASPPTTNGPPPSPEDPSVGAPNETPPAPASESASDTPPPPLT